MPELFSGNENETIAVVVNPKAGRGTDLSALVRAHRPDARVLRARNATEVKALTISALEAGSKIVFAAGGDGTIRTVAQELIGKNAVLAVLPLGTRNHFAQDVGIPLEMGDAFRLLLTGAVRRIDVGLVNGRAFLLYAALGLYPTFVRERERHETHESRHGKLPLVRALLTTLRRYPMLRVTVAAGERTAEQDSPFVFVANNIAMREHLPIGVISRPEMGALSVYTAHRLGRLELMTLLVRLWFGRVGEPADLSFACADRVRIETRRSRVWVATDGEVVRMEAPLEVELRRGALQLLVPGGSPGYDAN
jgi:diacylglycerol kinase family enzyme